jgi:DNA-binding NarL/FixJ family response regulator
MCGAIERLSPREKQVVALVAKGRANKQIAHEVEPPMSESTVKEHLRRIFQKAGVESRTELAALWHEHNAHHDSA